MFKLNLAHTLKEGRYLDLPLPAHPKFFKFCDKGRKVGASLPNGHVSSF